MSGILIVTFTTLVVCVAGAIIPLINTEIYLISAVALSPPEYVIPLVLAATFGQMIGKVAMFYGGAGIASMKSERVRNGVVRVRGTLENRPWVAKGVLLSSATLGLPPLYIVAIACGTIGMGVGSFFVIGTIGRLVHFAVVALLPGLAKGLLG